jgi:hypothetical protein
MKGRYRVLGPQINETITAPQHDRNALEQNRDSLYHRLEQGYDRIEHGLAEGNDVTTWEDFWVALLREYEQVCDELQRDLAA